MINSYTCIVIDDEPKAIELLKDSLRYLYNNIEVIGAYTEWDKALEAIRTTTCDILFSDISMPGKNGMELLKLVPDLDCEIIFITAHSEFALNAFKLAASGYILKPIDDAELKNTVDKTIERIKNKKLARSNIASLTILNNKIGIPNNNGIDYVDINSIIYFESINRCTKVVTKDGDILSSYNIGKFKTMLEQYMFYQVHRSYIINLNCIRRYETTGIVIMSNNVEIPIAKNERAEFLELFGKVTKIAGASRYNEQG
jgi:two-component system LytT family response regulator